MDNYIAVAVFCAAFILTVLIAQAVQLAREKKKSAMKDRIIAGKNDFILRLYYEYKKSKGIDEPFVVLLDPAPDFDIEAVFKAAEEEAKEEAATEEAEEGGAAL